MEPAITAYKENDLVWAKMKGFSPWPGKVARAPPEMRKAPKKSVALECIFFFGTKNYAWIEHQNIKPYATFKEDLIKASKTGAFREACLEIEEYIKDPEKYEAAQPKAPTAISVEEQFNRLRDGDANGSNSDHSEPEPSSSKTPPKKETPKPKSILVKRKAQDTPTLSNKQRKSDSPSTSARRKRNSSSVSLINDNAVASTSRGNPLLNRPVVRQPETPELDMTENLMKITKRNITPSTKTFGFLGLGIMGSAIVRNMLHSGHKVIVWNRTADKCRKFVDAGALYAKTPCDVVSDADITFACVADPQASKDIVFGNCGVLQAENGVGGYVELSTIDPETSQDICEAITGKGGKYLEVQLQGSKPQAETGDLIILGAGHRELFSECQSCFQSIARNSFFMGDVGNACKVNLIIQCMIGVNLAGLAEGMSLADRCGVNLQDVLDIIQLTTFSSQLVVQKAKEMFGNTFLPNQPLAHMQKDLRLALGMAEVLEHSMPTTAVTNEVYKHAKRLGYGKHDTSAVYNCLNENYETPHGDDTTALPIEPKKLFKQTDHKTSSASYRLAHLSKYFSEDFRPAISPVYVYMNTSDLKKELIRAESSSSAESLTSERAPTPPPGEEIEKEEEKPTDEKNIPSISASQSMSSIAGCSTESTSAGLSSILHTALISSSSQSISLPVLTSLETMSASAVTSSQTISLSPGISFESIPPSLDSGSQSLSISADSDSKSVAGVTSLKTMSTSAGTSSQATQASTGLSSQLMSAGISSQATAAGTSPQDTAAETSSQVPAAGTSSQEPVAGTSSQEPVAGPSSQVAAAGTSSQEPAAGTSSQEPAAGTSSQEPAAGTSSQDKAAEISFRAIASGTSSQATAAGTSSQATPAAGTSSQATTAGTSSRATPAGTSSQTTTAGTSSEAKTAGTSSEATTASTSSSQATATDTSFQANEGDINLQTIATGSSSQATAADIAQTISTIAGTSSEPMSGSASLKFPAISTLPGTNSQGMLPLASTSSQSMPILASSSSLMPSTSSTADSAGTPPRQRSHSYPICKGIVFPINLFTEPLPKHEPFIDKRNIKMPWSDSSSDESNPYPLNINIPPRQNVVQGSSQSPVPSTSFAHQTDMDPILSAIVASFTKHVNVSNEELDSDNTNLPPATIDVFYSEIDRLSPPSQNTEQSQIDTPTESGTPPISVSHEEVVSTSFSQSECESTSAANPNTEASSASNPAESVSQPIDVSHEVVVSTSCAQSDCDSTLVENPNAESSSVSNPAQSVSRPIAISHEVVASTSCAQRDCESTSVENPNTETSSANAPAETASPPISDSSEVVVSTSIAQSDCQSTFADATLEYTLAESVSPPISVSSDVVVSTSIAQSDCESTFVENPNTETSSASTTQFVSPLISFSSEVVVSTSFAQSDCQSTFADVSLEEDPPAASVSPLSSEMVVSTSFAQSACQSTFAEACMENPNTETSSANSLSEDSSHSPLATEKTSTETQLGDSAELSDSSMSVPLSVQESTSSNATSASINLLPIDSPTSVPYTTNSFPQPHSSRSFAETFRAYVRDSESPKESSNDDESDSCSSEMFAHTAHSPKRARLPSDSTSQPERSRMNSPATYSFRPIRSPTSLLPRLSSNFLQLPQLTVTISSDSSSVSIPSFPIQQPSTSSAFNENVDVLTPPNNSGDFVSHSIPTASAACVPSTSLAKRTWPSTSSQINDDNAVASAESISPPMPSTSARDFPSTSFAKRARTVSPPHFLTEDSSTDTSSAEYNFFYRMSRLPIFTTQRTNSLTELLLKLSPSNTTRSDSSPTNSILNSTDAVNHLNSFNDTARLLSELPNTVRVRPLIITLSEGSTSSTASNTQSVTLTSSFEPFYQIASLRPARAFVRVPQSFAYHSNPESRSISPASTVSFQSTSNFRRAMISTPPEFLAEEANLSASLDSNPPTVSDAVVRFLPSFADRSGSSSGPTPSLRRFLEEPDLSSAESSSQDPSATASVESVPPQDKESELVEDEDSL